MSGLRYETGRDMPPGMQELAADKLVQGLREAAAAVKEFCAGEEMLGTATGRIPPDRIEDPAHPPLTRGAESLHRASAVPLPLTREALGVWKSGEIATPVCALVRNDVESGSQVRTEGEEKMEPRELICKDEARAAVLRAEPRAAYCIDRVKAVDAVEVVHGYWFWKAVDERSANLTCSVCGSQDGACEGYRYCPNCGAKMDGERGTVYGG